MAEEWAHFTKGRTAVIDNWEWVEPEGIYVQSQKTIKEMFNRARDNSSDLRAARKENKDIAYHHIAFDGNRWYVGLYSSPAYFLDHQKYPPEDYTRDRVGRHLDWMHGFISRSDKLPETIPSLSREEIAKLHVEKILPIWRDDQAKGMKSEYQSPSSTQKTADIFPEETITRLKQAAKEGKPIFESIQVPQEAKEQSTSRRNETSSPSDDAKSSNRELIAGGAGLALLAGGIVSASKKNEAENEEQESKKKLSFTSVALCVVGAVLTGWAVWSKFGPASQGQKSR